MKTKAEHFYLTHALIMIVVIGAVLGLEHLFRNWLEDVYFRSLLVISIALALHFFLSSSLLETYQNQEKNIQKMVNETLHELNTPIATIQANLQMLEKADTDEKTAKRLHRIYQASENLSQLYQYIEHSLKAEISDIHKEFFVLYDIVDKSITKVADIQGNIHITNDIPQNISLYSEKFGFERSIDNLLSNAIKYNTPNGMVHFTFQDNTLSIADSGEGIDSKNLFIIFDKAYQENPSTKGFGLGLSIVKAFCDKERIRIKIQTTKQQGTIIHLDLTSLLT